MINDIIDDYSKYKIDKISKLKYSFDEYLEVVNQFKNSGLYEINVIGKSFEGRNIFSFKIGKGKIKIVAWSQMHGNEPVSTMALLDFMNFLSKNDKLNSIREKFLEQCTFYFLPLINPDGARNFTRRNAQGIDLNRDALKQTALESKILNSFIDKINPNFAFNMHDQESYYGTENCFIPTIMSFLTPSFDFEKTIDEYRKKSMQVISEVYLNLKKIIKEGIAKYNDTFMPNAFGDNVQKKKISTILFEGGYIIDDFDRQKVRKYYFLSIFFAVFSISENSFYKIDVSEYQKLPLNIKHNFVDILLKNQKIIKNGKQFVIDIAISKNILDSEQFTDTIEDYIILDIGDMSNKKGFKEIDCSNLKEIEDKENQIQRLKNADFLLEFFKIK